MRGVMIARSTLLAASLVLQGTFLAAQTQDRTTEPAPLDPAADPVNRLVAAQTVSGLIVALRIDGAKVTLERAQPARIPKPRRKGPVEGDSVTVTALSGESRVAAVTVPDQTVIVMERTGMSRPDRRTLHVALPTPRAIDAIEVRVSASRATARFDVRSAYDEICRLLPRDPVCADRTAESKR
jgi:hypothetical protein